MDLMTFLQRLAAYHFHFREHMNPMTLKITPVCFADSVERCIVPIEVADVMGGKGRGCVAVEIDIPSNTLFFTPVIY